MSGESANPIEAKVATPVEQLDAEIQGAERAFLNAQIQAGGQEGYLLGLKKAKEIFTPMPLEPKIADGLV